MRLLDLFCGAGGAAMGYRRAGFDEIIGVDITPQPNYPFTFVQADAMTFPLDGFDLIHASPPCQAFTRMSARWRGKGKLADSHVDLLTPTRARLARVSTPWIIENVIGAHDYMTTMLLLHGGMFGLGVNRPRRFESNVLLLGAYGHPARSPVGVYGRKPDGRWLRRKDLPMRAAKSLEEARAAMQIDWMTWAEIREAIPPVYTEYIGRQLVAMLNDAQTI